MDILERKQLIRQISRTTGIAGYALDKKLTDEQILELVRYLDIIYILRKSVNYNRYCQAQKTKAANDKLKAFLSPENSEIIAAGKWLLSAFSKRGLERRHQLQEQNLVHTEDYNDAVEGLQDTIDEIDDKATAISDEAKETIKILEITIDSLRNQLSAVSDYIKNNYGNSTWEDIKRKFNTIGLDNEKG
ncbi:hypothetical protein [Picosynechococcus sp. PCC 8807]|uniref:hypothetical protein n=1 Tax=Picosynechococcus sp. PCC 8807 TaxID=195248 RepID=UPI0008109524|nr:hypothetical protein [Picosynechococcus sp. PCC 8807]ANV90633.1 hypothetical protein AWQ24_08335 [Picosynechococcus sp. PCC 8807]